MEKGLYTSDVEFMQRCYERSRYMFYMYSCIRSFCIFSRAVAVNPHKNWCSNCKSCWQMVQVTMMLKFIIVAWFRRIQFHKYYGLWLKCIGWRKYCVRTQITSRGKLSGEKRKKWEMRKREMRRLSRRKHESKPFNWIETRFSLNLFAGWLADWMGCSSFFFGTISYASLRFVSFRCAAIVHTYTRIRVYIGIEIGLIMIAFISRNLSFEQHQIDSCTA